MSKVNHQFIQSQVVKALNIIQSKGVVKVNNITKADGILIAAIDASLHNSGIRHTQRYPQHCLCVFSVTTEAV